MAKFHFNKKNILLALTNLIPLFFVLTGKWSAFDLIFLFWFENLIIGFFSFIKITINPHNKEKAFKIGSIALGLFFLVHFGGFCFGHAVFIQSAFSEKAGLSSDAIISMIIEMFQYPGIQLALLAMFISHGFAYWQDIIDNQIEPPSMEMQKPYKRIMILHVGIILGGFLSIAFDQNIAVALLIILFKAAYDL